MENATEIDVDHRFPVIQAHLQSRRVTNDAGIVDQNVNRAILVIDGVHGPSDSSRIGDVQRNESAFTSGRLDGRYRHITLRFVAVGDDHMRTGHSQPFGDRPADAPGSARYDRTPAVQPEVSVTHLGSPPRSRTDFSAG